MAYKIVIADVTELSEEIIDVAFNSKIPEDSFARSSDIEAELVIHGKVSFDADMNSVLTSNSKIALQEHGYFIMLDPPSHENIIVLDYYMPTLVFFN